MLPAPEPTTTVANCMENMSNNSNINKTMMIGNNDNI